MSPAGYWPQLRAAMESGADAVYFGLTHFSARAKVGFASEELPEVMRTLHGRGVRGYITFNTLVFDGEIRRAAETIQQIAAAGADALIVQDVGIMQLAHEIAPTLELHASTQMSITDAAGVRLAQSLGAQRVTLARELALSEIRTIFEQTGCDLEVFVHGALCVAYSGQCFSSEAWGGRSANRGQCAQACRLPYELLVDGEAQPLGDARYLLSPGDLYALKQVPELIESGVASLKIEGRYKDAEYVSLTTQAYRKAVDEAWAGRPLTITRAEELQLEQAYSRGLGPHFLTGTNHQAVVSGRSPRHRGVLIGSVVHAGPESITISPSEAHRVAPLKPGDGVVFDAANWRSPEEAEEGGHIYDIVSGRNGSLTLRFGNGAIQSSRIRAGDLVWRTHDPDVSRAAKPFTAAAVPLRRQPVHVQVTAREGEPLITHWSLLRQPDIRVTIASPASLGKAQTSALTRETMEEQLGRLGNTAYELAELELITEGQPFVPASLLNRLRRDAVEQLRNAQEALPAFPLSPLPSRIEPHLYQEVQESKERATPQLHVLVRNQAQLEAALSLQPASITLDYLDLYGLRPSVERVKASGIPARVASPRILKPGESRIAQFLLSLQVPILVRAGGLLEMLRKEPHSDLIGDFSLNAANFLSVEAYRNLGLGRLTATHDLNAAQITALARETDADFLEVIAYQHLPVFHTEHCVFCRFLSTGTTYRDCGRPCEKHEVALRDQNGRAHPVVADVGCRNTVFGAEAQEGSAHLTEWLEAGIRHFRLEFVHETAPQLERVFRAFAMTFAGKISLAQLSRELRAASPEGVTEGSLFVPKEQTPFPVLNARH